LRIGFERAFEQRAVGDAFLFERLRLERETQAGGAFQGWIEPLRAPQRGDGVAT
jgi:hypothetical protein